MTTARTPGNWSADELHRIGNATEIELAPRRPDGTLRPYTTMWIAGAGDDLYVRSAGGAGRPWYRHALTAGTGRARAGGIEYDVNFSRAEHHVHGAIDANYHDKYDHYGPGPVGAVTGADAHPVTIRLLRSGP